MEFLVGQMEDNIEDFGIMENNMELEYIEMHKDKKEKENGIKEKKLDGQMNDIILIKILYYIKSKYFHYFLSKSLKFK